MNECAATAKNLDHFVNRVANFYGHAFFKSPLGCYRLSTIGENQQSREQYERQESLQSNFNFGCIFHLGPPVFWFLIGFC